MPMTICAPRTRVLQLVWNPVLPSMLAVVYSNGSMALFMVSAEGSASPDCCTLPPAEGITCASWSPKGKQIVTGKANGTLTQYKPDLKEAKTMPAPPSANNALAAQSLLWISTYQFLGAFKDKSDPNSRLCLYIVHGSKAGPTTYTNFDDVCYSTGEVATQSFEFSPIMDWQTILCSSANGIELGVLGSQDKECSSWIQWCLPEFRAELPLKGNAEKFPIGMGVAYNTEKILPVEVKNTELLFPSSMPILFLLREDGLLCGFYVVNLKKDAPKLTKPAVAIPSSGLRTGNVAFPSVSQTIPSQMAPTTSSQAPKALSPIKPIGGGSSFPSAGFGGSPFGGAPLGQPPSGLAASSGGPPAFGGAPSLPKPNFGALSTSKASEPPKLTKIQPQTTVATPSKSHEPKTVPREAKEVVPTPKERIQAIEKRYQSAIVQEVQAFQKELADFKRLSATNPVDEKSIAGSQDEKLQIRSQTESMENFCSDLKEITKSQSKEIHQLQAATLECYEWCEEARTRDIRNKDPKYQRLLRNRSLDPVSQKKLSGVVAKFMYLDQQINEVNQALDLQWKEHLTSRTTKSSARKLTIPSPEYIYRSILTNHQILDVQKKSLSTVAKLIKELKIRMLTSPWHDKDNASMNATFGSSKCGDLTQLTESFMEKTKLDDSKSIPKTPKGAKSGASPMTSTFSPDKESALRHMLQNRGTHKVRSLQPQSPNESRFLKLDASFNDNLDESIKNLLDAAKVINQPNTPKLEKERLILQLKESLVGKTPNASLNLSSSFLGSKADMVTPPKSKESLEPAKTTFGGLTSTPKPASIGQRSTAPLEVSKPTLSFGLGSGAGLATTTPTTTTSTTSTSGGFFGNLASSNSASLLPASKADVKPSGKSTSSVSSLSFGSALPTSATSSVSSFFGSKVSSASVMSPKSSGLTITPIAKTPTVTPVPSKVTPVPAVSVVPPAGKPSGFAFGATSSSAGGFSFGSSATTVSSGKTPAFGTPSGFVETKTTAALEVDKPSFSSGSPAKQRSPSPAFSGASKASTSTAPTLAKANHTITPASLVGFGTTTPPASGSIFGSSKPASTASASVFGGTTSTTSSSMFGGATPTPSSSIFGSSTGASSPSVFGGTSSTPTTSIFGGDAKDEPKKSATVFGGAGTPADSSTPSVFGGSSSVASSVSKTTPSTTTPLATGSVLGSIPATTASSIFGDSATGGSSIFGGPAPSPSTPVTTPSSAFGGASTTTTTSSMFGATTPSLSAPGGSGGIFGGGPATASTALGSPMSAVPATSGSMFGTTPGASSAAAPGSIFQSPPTTTSSVASGSIFGSAPSSSSVFGGSAPAASSTSGASVFGSTPAASSSGSIFGGASTTTATTSSTPFGGAASAGGIASSFGSALSFGGGAPASTGSPFGSSATSQPSGSIFGGSSAFGSAPTSTSQSLFGGTSTSAGFGQPAFGSPATTTASTPAFGGAFGGSNQSTASAGFGAFASTAQSTFGTPTPSTASSAFGAPPAFGSPPSAFGGNPSFGGAPAFGGSASFGGAPAFGGGGGSVFGGGAPAPAAGFGNMAQATNAPTFGSIAQSTNAPTFGAMATQPGAPSFGGMTQQPSTFGGSPSVFGSNPTSPGGFGATAPQSPSSPSFSGWRG
eukprot:maker-scaffold64_size435223-snap-gene-2.25 protein:Tk02488 transcript:maker-scaffold64_size435223-snap-gene-2.25-mRNA-1 annotation:"nuclear pore complex protein nup214 isoform x3"